MGEVNQHAAAVLDYLKENPAATVGEIVEKIDDPEFGHNEAVDLLDTHAVGADGSITNNGPGQGGGWVPPAEMSDEHVEIGFRWPDGTIRDSVFNRDDPNDWAAMGMTMPVFTEQGPPL